MECAWMETHSERWENMDSFGGEWRRGASKNMRCICWQIRFNIFLLFYSSLVYESPRSQTLLVGEWSILNGFNLCSIVVRCLVNGHSPQLTLKRTCSIVTGYHWNKELHFPFMPNSPLSEGINHTQIMTVTPLLSIATWRKSFLQGWTLIVQRVPLNFFKFLKNQ